MPDITHNRKAWNRLSGPNCPWSVPVSDEQIEQAHSGHFHISLAGGTLPEDWIGDVRGQSILCLASGGGQQAPLLAAAGADVTVFDLSDAQLDLDRKLAQRHNLQLRIEQGSMTDLSRFADESFELILNPVSSCYVPDILPVWRECARILKLKGRLISGSINPVNFLFEENDGSDDRGLVVKHPLPFIERDVLSEAELSAAVAREMTFTWSHSLDELIQGQISCGMVICGFLESRRTDPRAPALNRYANTYITTMAQKTDSFDQTSDCEEN